MADTQSILQLGIEAARSGDKAEARELFRLVTREDPNNAQGWLWLAGVAEDREEKRAALERVVQIEPGNELARKGLAALGGARATTPSPADSPTFDTGTTTPIQAVDAGRATPPARSADDDLADAFDSIDDYAAAPESGRARVYNNEPQQVGGYVPPDFGDEDYDLSEYQNRPRVTAADLDQQDRDGDTVVVVDDDDRRRRGIGAWIPLLLALLVLGALAFWLLRNVQTNTTEATDPNGGAVVGSPEASAGGVAEASGSASGPATASDGAVSAPGVAEGSPAGDATTSAPGDALASPAPDASPAAPEASAPGDALASPAPDASAPAPGGGEPVASPAPDASPAAPETSAPAPAPGGGDVATANPAVVGNDQVLTAGAWEFGYTGIRNFATGSYGGATPSRGQYEIVLLTVRNNSGAPAQIPDGFFVLKDAQGRVYDFNRAASVDYINRFGGTGPGGAGDYAADTQIGPGAPLGSVPLLFDIAPDATNLVLFSRENTSQGFLVR